MMEPVKPQDERSATILPIYRRHMAEVEERLQRVTGTNLELLKTVDYHRQTIEKIIGLASEQHEAFKNLIGDLVKKVDERLDDLCERVMDLEDQVK